MESDVSISVKKCCLFVVLFIVMVLNVCFIACKHLFLCVFPTKTKTIADDVILITGGGRGIGRQIALKFAKLKPKHIILWGRGQAALKKTAEDVFNLGVPCSVFICDVCDRELIYQRSEEVKKSIGEVTVLVNNAGVFSGGRVVDDTEENIEKTITVNAMSHLWTYKAFLPGMIAQGHGHIVTMSSMLGIMPLPGASSYCTSKFATTGMSEALLLELQEYPDIHLTSIHPYQVENSMFQGLKLRFPRLIPPLSEERVAEATVKAVISNKKIVLMPLLMYLIVPCLSLFPAKVMAPLHKFLGVHSALDGILTQKNKKE